MLQRFFPQTPTKFQIIFLWCLILSNKSCIRAMKNKSITMYLPYSLSSYCHNPAKENRIRYYIRLQTNNAHGPWAMNEWNDQYYLCKCVW